MRSPETVAEYSFTGMATRPKERVSEAIERALAGIGKACRKSIVASTTWIKQHQ
jgi:hypothetical protein